jgi:hypothetical protein
MKKVLPHLLAVALFYLVTILFFSPAFFENKTLSQHDIEQFVGTAKSVIDYRENTGKEALWVPTLFSGMPAYLVSVQWSFGPLTVVKMLLTGFLPSPYRNIFLAFVCYYILLLSFRVRPVLAIAGALAFGLSSYMIVGLLAGHNIRIASIAFIPLVMAGIHLTFTGKRLLGFGLTALALAMHLRENHLQMTYYLILLVLAYGLVQLIYAVKEKTLPDLFKNVGILVPAALLAAATYFGPIWAVQEYSAYSIRGKSELTKQGAATSTGLERDYAFAYSNSILEPMTLVIPDFYGGASTSFLVQDQESNVYQALVNSGDQQIANQLANYTSSYWGGQPLSAPYYGGAVIFFLFVVGLMFAEKKYIWWLVPISVFGVMLTWGDHFKAFNYFMFDYFPLYNKFRSVTFATLFILFAMPLIGLLGLEKLFTHGLTKEAKKKILIAFGITGGLCVLVMLFSGVMSFLKEEESSLPYWFTSALIADRKSLLLGDAFRSLIFMGLAFVIIYFDLIKRLSPVLVYAALIFLVGIDMIVVDKRYVSKESFQRKREATANFAPTAADQEILKDKSYFRVYNIQSPFSEARTSYFHHSVGGYHGAKMRRYQDLYDSCLVPETQRFITDAQQGKLNMASYGVLNMLNVKYITYGPNRENIIPNFSANGPAWFVQSVEQVNSANEELTRTGAINTRTSAVMDASQFSIGDFGYDSAGSIQVVDRRPDYLKYESNASVNSLAVFSEIYYPKGWVATVDGKEVSIARANYVLRALEIPAGKHTIEFTFKPDAYYVGNTITMASSWIVFLLMIGSAVLSFRKER